MDNLIFDNANLNRYFGCLSQYVLPMQEILRLDRDDVFIMLSAESIKLRDVVGYVFQKSDLVGRLIIGGKKLYRRNEIAEIYRDNSKVKDILDGNCNFSFYDVLDELINEETRNL